MALKYSSELLVGLTLFALVAYVGLRSNGKDREPDLVGPQNTQPADTPSPAPRPNSTIAPEVRSFAMNEVKRALGGKRYMEEQCKGTTHPDWGGFPLRDCHYVVAKGTPNERKGRVILLNPDDLQLARWIFTSCTAIDCDESECRENMLRRIKTASHGQFPVAGVVLEDMDEDGVFEFYPFKNGLTVSYVGVPYQSQKQLNEETLARAIDPGTKVRTRMKLARIVSTTQQEFEAYVGLEPSEEKWDDTIARVYGAAWGQDENPLITAWAMEHRVDLGCK